MSLTINLVWHDLLVSVAYDILLEGLKEDWTLVSSTILALFWPLYGRAKNKKVCRRISMGLSRPRSGLTDGVQYSDVSCICWESSIWHFFGINKTTTIKGSGVSWWPSLEKPAPFWEQLTLFSNLQHLRSPILHFFPRTAMCVKNNLPSQQFLTLDHES